MILSPPNSELGFTFSGDELEDVEEYPEVFGKDIKRLFEALDIEFIAIPGWGHCQELGSWSRPVSWRPALQEFSAIPSMGPGRPIVRH